MSSYTLKDAQKYLKRYKDRAKDIIFRGVPCKTMRKKDLLRLIAHCATNRDMWLNGDLDDE